MTTIAVIGGTGMNQWPGLEIEKRLDVTTPYGAPSAPLLEGKVYGVRAIFLARHGEGHKIPPHKINYRANMRALKDAGVKHVVAVAAVGGIAKWFPPGGVAVPHDLLDYTYGREHTYSDGSPGAGLDHIEFTQPYSERVRAELIRAAKAGHVEVGESGVMAVTQGPRLESTAEVQRLLRDGSDMIGMTGMPEAGLARELGLEYACLAVSVNWAAGLGTGDIHAQIHECLETGMSRVRTILSGALPALT